MKLSKLLFLSLFVGVFSQAQVGVNASAVDPSAALDIQFGSTPKGLLTPRMTTVQKLAIANPADGLMVYDTDLKSFYYYKSAVTGPPAIPATWNRMTSEATGRLNFKRIKSTDVLATVLAEELTNGGNSKYQLKANTLYEINGTVSFDKPIDLNNAYMQGLDSGDDIIVSSGNVFDGDKGGTVKGVTVRSTGGKVFNLSGANTENFIFRDCIVANSASVGSINGLGLVFISVVQFSGNTTGITYSNISQLLLSNLGWFSTNLGTFETFTGAFGLVQKQGGFSNVTGAKIGIDVSSNPTINGDATMESVVFTGTLTAGGAYVKGYTAGNYAGYNFNNKWAITCGGIPVEGDRFTTGNFYLNRTIAAPTLSFPTINTSAKLSGTTIPTNLYRLTDGATDNRLVYNGQKTRTFTVTSSISMQVGGSGTTDFLFFFVKYTAAGVGSVVTSSETFIDSNSGFVQSFPVTGTVQLSTGEYVELHGARLTGTNKTLTFNSYNMSLR